MGNVIILQETVEKPITLMGQRAGICWESDILNAEKNYKRGLSCLEAEHGRVLEYVNVEMILEGYSARVIREWYTHIGGAPTRLQASTRYVDYGEFKYIIPNSIKSNEDALRLYKKHMEGIKELCYQFTEEFNIPREDVALFLPLGMETRVVDKRNLRKLMEMSHQRLCTRAYWEYRELMRDICDALKNISEEWKYIVENYFLPKCKIMGYCPEKQSCGLVNMNI